LNLDDFFITDRKSRKHLNQVKNDCIKTLKNAAKIFKEQKAYEFVAGTYADLALEHHSFNSPLRSKLYLFKANSLVKRFKLTEPALLSNLKRVGKFPLIGSDRVTE
jgi:hypothetical protein